MPSYESQFWHERDEYHELAETYERYCEMTHPTQGSCPICGSCFWGATSVTYYEYRGPQLW